MRNRTVLMIVLAVALVAPGHATSQTDDCTSGSEVVASASGQGPSWGHVIVDKPAGDALAFSLTVNGLHLNGPSMAAYQVTGPNGSVFDHGVGAEEAHGSGASVALSPGPTSQDVDHPRVYTADLQEPWAAAYTENTIWREDRSGVFDVVFAFDTDATDHQLSWAWELTRFGSCAEAPGVSSASGPDVEMYTADEFEGTMVAEAGTYVPETVPVAKSGHAVGSQHAVVVRDGRLSVEVPGEPFVSTLWERYEGEGIGFQAPSGATDADAACQTGTDQGDWCTAWGPSFDPGMYDFEIDGRTAPGTGVVTSSSSAGPSILAASTASPAAP